MEKVSRFAPEHPAALPEIAGVHLAACAAGIKYADRTDLLLAIVDNGTTVAGVLTRSKTASAPVDWCRTQLPRGTARALVVNSGNANAFTGRRGTEATAMTAETAASAVGCAPEDVFLASTGVIGEPLDAAAFAGKLAELADDAGPGSWSDAAAAIMTTDTFPKVATRTVSLGDGDVTLNGIAKGSGMIAPDMATMLSFIFTDAPVAAPLLQDVLAEGIGPSFNAITVDGDTSTSDTVLAFATGKASVAPVDESDSSRLAILAGALDALLLDLALQVVKDGEGLTKFVTVTVEGAETRAAAHNIGMAIANSPLVKTAIAGEDPNWGRIVMAVGKSGEAADRDRLAIWLGDTLVADAGEVSKTYNEEDGAAHMKEENNSIRVDVGVGEASATVYTCDLTHDYVSINADYRS
ncbi:MAG: bifunctional glutamate N-acetyltransferase/amino-acid acetyltransferase ArgJ [Hyphomicrobiaceae bacterium]